MSRFKVTEWCNGYELEDTVTGLTAWLGDGVDAIWIDTSEPDEGGFEFDALQPGTPELLKAFNELYNDMDIYEVFEAYWSDYYYLGLLDLEVSAQAYAVHLMEESL